MKIHTTRKTKLCRTLSAIVSLALLSGCAHFREKYDPAKEGWARQKGDTSLTVQGYTLAEGNKNICFEKGFKTVLLPDDDYSKKYLNYLIHTNRDPMGRSISQEGRTLVRFPNWKRHCVYNFKEIPAGKWIVVFEVRNHLMPLITVATDKGTATGNTIVSGETYIWAPLDIKPSDHDLKKKLVFNKNLPPQDSVLNFQWGDDVSVHQGELADWSNPPDQVRK